MSNTGGHCASPAPPPFQPTAPSPSSLSTAIAPPRPRGQSVARQGEDAELAELVGVEAGGRGGKGNQERRAPQVGRHLLEGRRGHRQERRAVQGGGWLRALQVGGRRQGGRGRAPRGMDGALRPPEDRQVLLPHALLRAREQAARLLQEEAQGQHGTTRLPFP